MTEGKRNTMDKKVISGTLSQLSEKELKGLRDSVPRSTHWLVRGVEIPRLAKMLPGRVNAAGVIGIAVVPISFFTLPWMQSIFTFFVAFIFGKIAYEMAQNALMANLPADHQSTLAKGIFQAALDGDQKALDSVLECTTGTDRRFEFSLPGVGAMWEPQLADKDEERIAKTLAQLQLADATNHDQPAESIAAAPAAPSWSMQVQGHFAAIAVRAGEAAPQIHSQLTDITRYVASINDDAESVSRTVGYIRNDTLQAVQVYTDLAEDAGHITLQSGATPTEELSRTLAVIAEEAHRLHESGQASQADELSYLRRLNEMRFKPSALDQDGT